MEPSYESSRLICGLHEARLVPQIHFGGEPTGDADHPGRAGPDGNPLQLHRRRPDFTSTIKFRVGGPARGRSADSESFLVENREDRDVPVTGPPGDREIGCARRGRTLGRGHQSNPSGHAVEQQGLSKIRRRTLSPSSTESEVVRQSPDGVGVTREDDQLGAELLYFKCECLELAIHRRREC